LPSTMLGGSLAEATECYVSVSSTTPIVDRPGVTELPELTSDFIVYGGPQG